MSWTQRQQYFTSSWFLSLTDLSNHFQHRGECFPVLALSSVPPGRTFNFDKEGIVNFFSFQTIHLYCTTISCSYNQMSSASGRSKHASSRVKERLTYPCRISCCRFLWRDVPFRLLPWPYVSEEIVRKWWGICLTDKILNRCNRRRIRAIGAPLM